MYITDENVLSVGLVDQDGHEPDDPMYARQPIALRWDPSSDEEVFVNVEAVTFPPATRRWKAVSAVLCVNRTNVLLLEIPIGLGGLVVDANMHTCFHARHLSFRRDALVNKYGDYRLHLAITEKRPVGAHENRLVNDELIIEWPRRPRRNKELRGQVLEFDVVTESAYAGGFPLNPPAEPVGNNPLSDLYKRRYGDYVPIAEQDRIRERQLAAIADLQRQRQALEDRERFLAARYERAPSPPMHDLFGVDRASEHANPWQSAVHAPYGELIPGRKLTITNIEPEKAPAKPAERRIVVPVPRFWGQLNQALNEPKKAEPPKEMPVVEPTPAGAEELIDWARADESRAAWAEKLSIPRVTRMLKEKTSYGKTWSESDLVALAG